MKRIAILISGRGSNMKALLDAGLPAHFCVISNNPSAPGLEIARRCGVQTAIVNHREFADRTAFDAALASRILEFAADWVVLAGFMRILTDTFVQRFNGRIVNIHPSLLPAFPGTDTHRRALAEGVKLHGCTVHLVTAELDRGPILVQAAVPILPGDDETTLAARVLEQEHRIYPAAIGWLLEGKARVSGQKVTLDSELAPPGAMIFPSIA
jgi:phosphoribosylglycinamide formyltransferase 1